MLRKGIFVIFSFFTIHSSVYSQATIDFSSLPFQNIGFKEGFTQNSVYDIFQDSRGYMWFTTPNGLFRYDGYNFKAYANIQDDSTSLAQNEVFKISEDKYGNLWIITRNSLNKYSPISDNFKTYPLDELGVQKFMGVHVDRYQPNHLWLGSNNNLALLIFDEEMDQLNKIVYPLIPPEYYAGFNMPLIRDIIQNTDGSIWITYKAFVTRIEYKNEEVAITHHQKNRFITSINYSNNGDIFLGSKSGLSKVKLNGDGSLDYFTEDTEIILPDKLKKNKVFDIIHTHNNNFTIAFWDIGLVNYNPNENIFSDFSSLDSFDKFGMAKYSCSFIDKSQTMWIGSFGEGLYMADLEKKPFHSLESLIINGTSVSNKLVNQITGDKHGNIWVATSSGGINQYNINETSANVITDFNRKNGIPAETFCWAILYTSSNNLIYSVQDDDWMGRIIYNDQGQPIKNFKYNQSQFPNVPFSKFRFFYEDANNEIWAACHANEGLYKINFEGNTVIFNKINAHEFNTNISCLFMDNKGTLWVGTMNKGIYIADFDDQGKIKQVTRPGLNNADFEKLITDPIFSIFEDKNNNLWMTSFGSGVIKLTFNNKSNNYELKQFRVSSGLTNDAVYSILPNGDDLWISSDGGLSKLNTKTEQIVNYNYYDGLQSNNFRKWSAFKNNNLMFFGGPKGFSYFNPDLIKPSEYLPNVQITSFKILQNETPIEQYTYFRNDLKSDREVLVLKPNQHTISVEFASLQFNNPIKNNYKYQLEGADENWIEASSGKRYASYSFLKPGEYTFKVMASNTEGGWNENYRAINIKLRPHWYNTWWARTLYTFSVLGIVILILSFQKKRQVLQTQLEIERLERDHEIELNKTKLTFFTNISHEIKTPLTIITGILDKVLHQNIGDSKLSNDLNVVMKNAKRMLRLVTQLMDFRKVEAGHMPVNFIKTDMVNFLKELSGSFETFIKGKNLNFEFISSFDSKDVIFDADKIEKVVSNLVSNAVKHTPEGGEINLSVEHKQKNEIDHDAISKLNDSSEGYIVINVQDTGKGIPKEQIEESFTQFYQVKAASGYTEVEKGVGIGLAYSRMLVELHNGVLFAESEVNKGSTFKIVIPLTQENYIEDDKFASGYINTALKNSQETYNPTTYVTGDAAHKFDDGIKFHDYEVLIVEDNEEIRAFLNEFLSPSFKVYEAVDGQKGLDTAVERIPDIIISDVMMPNMDGYEMCKNLKTNEKTSHIPIIMLTANNEPEQRIEGLKSGADSYIPKPFNLEHLKTRIEKLLELRNTLKKKYLSLSGNTSLDDLDVNADDKNFLKEMDEIIEENLSNSEFSVVDLETSMGYSRMQLYRKIKSITDLTAVEYIRNYRLKRAVDMIHSTQLRISEIVYSVGFTNPSYFAKCFKLRYGKKPSDFIEEARKS